MGLELALSALAGFFIGRWLDEQWGTAPWLLISGLAVGTAGGFIHFIREAIAIGKRQDELGSNRRGKL
jgi:F0F1-type ATP synthase assembly protein I